LWGGRGNARQRLYIESKTIIKREGECKGGRFGLNKKSNPGGSEIVPEHPSHIIFSKATKIERDGEKPQGGDVSKKMGGKDGKSGGRDHHGVQPSFARGALWGGAWVTKGGTD